MRKAVFILLCFFSIHLTASQNIEQVYQKFNQENISTECIERWLSQFDPEDRAAAILLLEQIDYFSYQRLMKDLKHLHKKVLRKLADDGFIGNPEKEVLFDRVDFSKTYSAKSGDLVSYFYRSANKIRAVSFNDLSDLNNGINKSEKALVILEDYVSTGTQFLLELYSKKHCDLFNQYKKVYFAVLVANSNAIDRFQRAYQGRHDSLAQDFILILDMKNEEERQRVRQTVKNILPGQIEMVYFHEEIPLIDARRDPEMTARIAALLDKYNLHRYLGGNFSTFGHTVFFYNCPNNLPEILWDPKSVKRDGSPWNPIFRRVEDLSIYDIAKGMAPEDQIW